MHAPHPNGVMPQLSILTPILQHGIIHTLSEADHLCSVTSRSAV